MINFVVAVLMTQSAPVTLADQELTFSLSTVGDFDTPLGMLKDPLFSGLFTIAKTKDVSTTKDTYRLKLAMKRTQSKLVEAFTDGFSDQKGDPEAKAAIYKDKDYAYFVNSYFVSRSDFKLEAFGGGNGYSPPGEVLSPLAMATVIAQRSLNQPQLRKEFFLMEDGPRKFFVTFRPNLNANTDTVPGDVAYKFDLKLKDEEGEYPSFFSGAIRLNTKTRLVQYITAVSDPEHQPHGPEDASLGGGKSYAIRIETKPAK